MATGKIIRDKFLTELFQHRGIQSLIADHLGLSKPMVNRWKRVPLKHVYKVSVLLKVPIKEMRPDFYE